jgi:hypothetical protein
MIDLHPAGYSSSGIYDVAGRFQAGYGIIDNTHAMLWTGTAQSAIDLHAYLPAGYLYSTACGVDSLGNVVGYACPANNPSYVYAVLWQVPEPGTILLLGLGAALINKKAKSKKQK